MCVCLGANISIGVLLCCQDDDDYRDDGRDGDDLEQPQQHSQHQGTNLGRSERKCSFVICLPAMVYEQGRASIMC